jgi:hypothetical protein
MDIVLGVSMTPTTVRMALVEGDQADGAIVDHDTFETSTAEGSATPVEQVVSAVLGTREGAEDGGHHLKSVGVAWSDHHTAAQLRDGLAAAGVKDVLMVSELHAAGALAQAAGQAVGYGSTGLLFIDKDTATLSVVQGSDGSISKVLSRSLHSVDAMDVLTEMASAVAAQDTPPQGMFVIGSGVDVAAVKAHLTNLVDIPVSAPEDAELALARGAALASASAPVYDAATAGLAYSLATAGTTAGSAYSLASASTQLAPGVELTADEFGFDELGDVPVVTEQGRKPFLLVGSALTSIFVVGVVALAISVAVSVKPTGDQRPAPPQAAVAPSVQMAAPPVAPPPAAPPPAPEAPVVAETMQAPAPRHIEEAPRVVKEAPPVVKAPVPEAPAPVPEAPAPIPVSLPAPEAPPILPPPPAAAPQPQQPPWLRGPGNGPGNQYPGGYGRGGYPGAYGPGGPSSPYPNQYPGQQPYPGQYQGQYPGENYPPNAFPSPKHHTTCVFFICSRS